LSQALNGTRCETIIVVGNLHHCLFAHGIGHQMRQGACILRALTPMFGVVVEQGLGFIWGLKLYSAACCIRL
jgi:hypothetical protein